MFGHNVFGQKTLSCFSLILLPSGIFLGHPIDNGSENSNQLPGWTLALLEAAQPMQSQEEGGWGEPEHLLDVLCSTGLDGVKKTTGKGATSCTSVTVLPDCFVRFLQPWSSSHSPVVGG